MNLFDFIEFCHAKKAQVPQPGIWIRTVIHGKPELRSCMLASPSTPAHLRLLAAGNTAPHFPPSALEDLGWVGPPRAWKGAGISPSSSVRPLLEQEAANVESRCASEGNQVCRRQGEEAQSSLGSSTCPAPNKTPLQQRQAHHPARSLPHPPICLSAAGSSLALKILRHISSDQAEDFQQQDVRSSRLHW